MATEDLKGKTAKGLLWGGMGFGMMEFLSLVFGVFLARLLNAEDYGIVGLLAIFSQLSASFVESGFSKALINRKEIVHRDYNSVFWFSVVVGIACYVLLFFCAPLIARFYNEPRLISLSRYAFLVIIVGAVHVPVSAYMNKKLMVKQRAISNWTALIISNFVGVFLAFRGFAHWGIVTQGLLCSFIGVGMNYYFSKWRPTFAFSFTPIKEMFPYSVKLLGTRILNVINANIFTIFLAKFFSIKLVGNYNQANKWGMMGNSLISNTMIGVTQPVLATIDNNDKQRHYAAFRKMIRFTAFVGFPVMFGLAFVAKEFIVMLITEKWIESAWMLSILSIGYAFYIISVVFSETLAERGRSDWYLYVSAISGILQLGCLFLLHPWGIKVMLVSSIGVQLVTLALWFVFIHKSIGYTLKHFLGDVFSYAFIAVFCITVVHFLNFWIGIENIFLLFLWKVLCVGVLYVAILYLCKSVILRESFEYLRISFVGLYKKILSKNERDI